MSQANVEIARRVIDAFDRSDLSSYDELFVPDLEWFPAGPLALQGEGYAADRGREGRAAYVRDRHVMWEEIRTVETEFRDLGDRVMMLGRLQVRVRSSGVTRDSPSGVIFDFRDGKISRMRAYLDRLSAQRAAGLSE
jgi:ketosteroid isomerase-like protein